MCMICTGSYLPMTIKVSDPYVHVLTASLGVILYPNIPSDDTITSLLRKIRWSGLWLSHIARVILDGIFNYTQAGLTEFIKYASLSS